ncbi:MAG: hypothetical protein K6B40_01430 [Firmicutes bacterium]|nr:hypothetical protein [Bacillota bacterium]
MRKTEARLKQILAEQFSLREEDLTGDFAFDGLAMDSLEWMELAVALEEEFDIPLADIKLRQIKSLRQMAEIITERIRE